MTIELAFLGGANEIGASCAALDIDGVRLLVDCGQRMNVEVGEALPHFGMLEEGPPIRAVLLTHAHADHIGALPALEPSLPDDCPIYATESTIALTRVMLHDTLRIMAMHRQGDGDQLLFPPAAVSAVLERFQAVRWGKAVSLGNGLAATWFPAGHILGAAMIEVTSRTSQVLFTGDVSIADQRSVSAAFTPAIRPQVLVIESTYGGRLHAHRPTQERQLVQRVAETLADGGHVLFPTFALGRAQEVLLLLGHAMREGTLPRHPVFADGLVRAVSKVYSRQPEDLAPRCRRLWEQGLDPIFSDDVPILPVRDNAHRERIAAGPPCVVVASSGMLQGGASQFYARRWIGEPANAILITGYQDEEAPGKALLNLVSMGQKEPRAFDFAGVLLEVRCRVEKVSLSAHADAGELAALAAKLRPDYILPVHGDDDARTALAELLRGTCHGEVILPMNGERFTPATSPAKTRTAPTGRTNPLMHWPPWDPHAPRPLDLERFHHWLSSFDPPVRWVTVDDLAELWKSPEPVGAEDLDQVRQCIGGGDQRFFVPDSKRPFLLRVVASASLPTNGDATRLPIEMASAIIRGLFPASSGLTRFGFYPEEGVVRLVFQFPEAIRQRASARLADLARRIHWRCELNSTTRRDDLLTVARRWFPEIDVGLVQVQSDEQWVLVRCGPDAVCEIDDAQEQFLARTGFRLIVERVAHE